MLSWETNFAQHPDKEFYLKLDNKTEERIVSIDIKEDWVYFEISLSYLDYFRDHLVIPNEVSDLSLSELICKRLYEKMISK